MVDTLGVGVRGVVVGAARAFAAFASHAPCLPSFVFLLIHPLSSTFASLEMQTALQHKHPVLLEVLMLVGGPV